MTQVFPLEWPAGWPRTPVNRRQSSRFTTTLHQACMRVLDEVRRLGGTNAVISSNVPARQDGLPYANWKKRSITDYGIAVYFTLDRQQRCIPCDKWDRIEDNVHAVALSIEALRGLDRWGAKSMVDAAFRGFVALPAPETCWGILGISPTTSRDEIDTAWRAKARTAHPDTGGSDDQMARINKARDEALQQARNS